MKAHPLILGLLILSLIIIAVMAIPDTAEAPSAPGVSVDIDRKKPRPPLKAPTKPKVGKR